MEKAGLWSACAVCVLVIACADSYEVDASRDIAVHLDVASIHSVGGARPASEAKVVVAWADGNATLEFVRETSGRASFEGRMPLRVEPFRVTAILPGMGATTVLGFTDESEIQIRVHDLRRPAAFTSAMRFYGAISGADVDSKLYFSGDGLTNQSVYGLDNSLNVSGHTDFDMLVGTWEGAPPTEIFLIERPAEATFEEVPRVVSFVLDRDSAEVGPVEISFVGQEYPLAILESFGIEYSEGLLHCGFPSLQSNASFVSSGDGISEIIRTRPECVDAGTLHVEGEAFEGTKWHVVRFMGSPAEAPFTAGGVLRIDREGEDGIGLPNFNSLSIDRHESGRLAVSASLASGSLDAEAFSLVEMTSRGVPATWTIHSADRATLSFDITEIEVDFAAIGEEVEIDADSLRVYLRAGFDSPQWQEWPRLGPSHHLDVMLRPRD
jgi:hypothetical protein